ncbi:hypothetical protein PR202_gb24849 [Eleusine coracana subsp. coracana]|uniref:Uncharacterized protein n=1 Tax=Eleusine coracana subsp. coracana TaxID=191504 RepID=A0AAV5FM21_ELECO|nr:hypothetical protein PR202_gb24849 [Eleusine coracana subsp. coracana]
MDYLSPQLHPLERSWSNGTREWTGREGGMLSVATCKAMAWIAGRREVEGEPWWSSSYSVGSAASVGSDGATAAVATMVVVLLRSR